MTTIGAAGFEGPYGATWDSTCSCWCWHYTGGATWYTEGSNSLRFGCEGTPYTTYVGNAFFWYQTVNFDSDFTLKFDFNVRNATPNMSLRVWIDNDVKFSTTIGSTGETLDQTVDIIGYRGNHTFKIGIICINETTDISGIEIDNLRVTSEVRNKYVDIATGNDADSGETWALAYQTIKKGLDEIPDASYSVLHIAEGDYSAQAAIDLDKNVALLCEDYDGGNASPPLTVILPATA